ncbi:hypothetical protein P40081_11120 [Paenibacillus sp. FSL P4-0081]|nr:hypothetical protein P40081_11120 [Paenibacillus sp. FSL P4-0081]
MRFVRTLRERTVVPIALVSRFYLFFLVVKIWTLLLLPKEAFLRKAYRRPLPLVHNRSVLSAV